MSAREIPLMMTFLGQYRNPRVRLFRRNILNKVMQDLNTGKVHKVKAGVNGQCDAYAFIKSRKPVYGAGNKLQGWTKEMGHAIPVEIEFKGAKTPTSTEQKAWRAFCLEWGVPYLLLRALLLEDPEVTVLRWTKELDVLVATLG